MKRAPLHRPAQPGKSPLLIGRLFFLAITLTAACLVAPVSASARDQQQVHRYGLLPGVYGSIMSDGSMVISGGTGTTPLLSAFLELPADSRRGRGRTPAPFSAVTVEGAAGGQRGFSARRDDDGDGAVDEDPLDGRDNDGDGRIDEDFAAISDGMVVVHQPGRSAGAPPSHLEFYHWASPHLRAMVFLSSRDSGSGVYRLVLGREHWREATVVAERHDLSGKMVTARATAYVARVERPDTAGRIPADATGNGCDPTDHLWVGVVQVGSGLAGRAVIDGDELGVTLGGETAAIAVCVAESWLQLSRMLCEAGRVKAGVTDKLTGRQAGWIVPPLCATCRLAATPAFTWRTTAAGDLILSQPVVSGGGALPDPDLFQVGDRYLGAPAEISWRPEAGPAVSVAWTCMVTSLLDRPHDLLSVPYGQMPDLAGHQVAGRLEFTFPGLAADPEWSAATLRGGCLDGRPFSADLQELPVAIEIAPQMTAGDLARTEAGQVSSSETALLLNASSRTPLLSPQLLEGFPNPFSDVIQLRFRVPATVGEAFTWGKDEAPPAGLDLQAAVPWQGGTPSVSVKIYSIGGQELVTLFSGSQGPGESALQWSGTDSYGRQVASGTYFCKLQIDDWSVTRRLVFLR